MTFGVSFDGWILAGRDLWRGILGEGANLKKKGGEVRERSRERKRKFSMRTDV